MKSNFILLLTVFSLVFMGCGGTKAIAQPPSNINPIQMAEKQTNKMVEKFNLSPKQKVTVKAINLKYAKKMKIISQKGRSLSTLNAFKKMNRDKDAEMKTVLSKKQYIGYEKMAKEMKKNRKRRRR